MATFDDLQALNAMFAQNFAPINRLGAGQVAIAQNALARRQQIEDEARKNMFTQSLIGQQHQFTVGRDVAHERARMGLVDKTREFQKKQAILDSELRSKEAEAQFGRLTTERHKMSKEERLKEARQYGLDLPETATDFQIEQAIQGKAGESLQSVYGAMSNVEKLLLNQSGTDPETVQRSLAVKLAGDTIFAKATENYPDVRQGLMDGTVRLADVPAILKKKTGFFDLGSDDRQNAFLEAMSRAKIELADEEKENPDARKRPGYLQSLTLYQTLQKEALKHINTLRDPNRVKDALSALAPVPTAPQETQQDRLRKLGAMLGIGAPGAAAAQTPTGPPITTAPLAAPVPFPERVKTILNTAPSELDKFVPSWAMEQLGGRHKRLSDEQADNALAEYAANLRAEIARILALGSTQRGIQGKLDLLRNELARTQ